MQWKLTMGSIVIAAINAAAASGVANAQTCQELWVERNAYYNTIGYCFKTPRAKKYFVTKDCQVESEDKATFSKPVNARLKLIQDKERELGCSTNTTRGPTLADATCSQLWVERNAYYKAGGYCFRTNRAMTHFGGNEGCKAGLDDGDVEANFSDRLRDRIVEIMNLERMYGCD